MADSIKIKSPGSNPVPIPMFVVAGTAAGNDLDPRSNPISFQSNPPLTVLKQIFVRGEKSKPTSKRWRWIIILTGAAPSTTYSIQVQANGVPVVSATATITTTGTTAKLNLQQPTIIYPTNGENVSDEVDYLLAYGTSDPTAPIVECSVGPDEVGDEIYAEFIYNDGNGNWCAQFPPLPDDGSTPTVIPTDSAGQQPASLPQVTL